MRAKTVNENIGEKDDYIYVVHGTTDMESARSIVKNGYKSDETNLRVRQEGNVFGALVWPVEEWHGAYGTVTMKFRIPISELKSGFLIWDEEILKKVYGKNASPVDTFDSVFDPGKWRSKIPGSIKEFISETNKILKPSNNFPEFFKELKKLEWWMQRNDSGFDIFGNEDLIDSIHKKYPGSMDTDNKDWDDDWNIIQEREFYRSYKEELKSDMQRHIWLYREIFRAAASTGLLKEPFAYFFNITKNNDFVQSLIDKKIYNGFCGEGRFGKDKIYFGSYDFSIIEPIEYTANGKDWEKIY